MRYGKLLRFLHVALVLAAIFALSTLGALLSKAPKLIDHANVVLSNVDRTVIITGGYLRDLHVAQREQLKEITASQKHLNQTLSDLDAAVKHTDKNVNENVLPSVTMTVRSLDDSIQDFRGQTANLMADAHQNLVVLGDTQARLNESIAALDVPTLGRNVNLMAAQGVTISRNTASATAHLDGILADAHKEADKFVAPKTGWQKFKGALGVFWRVAAFAVVKAI